MGQQLVREPKRNAYDSLKKINVPYEDFKIVEIGSYFHAYDSTTDIGAEEAPADALEIYFTTPAATEIVAHFDGFCSAAGAVFKIEEAYGAGGASGAAVGTSYCMNRGTRKKTSALEVYKKPTAITSGGVVLWSETLVAGNRSSSENHLWCLAASTEYGISLQGADAANVAFVAMHWYERVLKA